MTRTPERQRELAFATAMGRDDRTRAEQEEDLMEFACGVSRWAASVMYEEEKRGFIAEQWEIGPELRRVLMLCDRLDQYTSEPGAFTGELSFCGVPVSKGGDRGSITLHARRDGRETIRRTMQFIEFRSDDHDPRTDHWRV